MASIVKILVIMTVCIVGISIFIIKGESCNQLNCLIFNRKSQYIFKTEYENTDKAFRALYSNKDQLLRMEVYSQTSGQQSDNFVEYKKMQIMGLYEDAKSPYPGTISDKITCDRKYKPVFKTLKNNWLKLEYYSGYLNERMQFGSCIDDQLVYNNQAVMFYCSSQKKWYHLEFISPLKSSSQYVLDIISTIKCKN